MKQVELVAQARAQLGSRSSRRLRKEGRLPINLYGQGDTPAALHVAARELEALLRQHAMFVHLRLDGKDQPAVLQALQHDPLTQELLHADFVRVTAGQKIEVAVPIRIHGPSRGEEAGGILVEQQNTIRLRCVPSRIPQEIETDIRSLGIHQSLHVRDLVLPEGVEAVDEPDRVLLSITEPRFTAEKPAEGTEGAAAAAEPEVIGKPAEETRSD